MFGKNGSRSVIIDTHTHTYIHEYTYKYTQAVPKGLESLQLHDNLIFMLTLQLSDLTRNTARQTKYLKINVKVHKSKKKETSFGE